MGRNTLLMAFRLIARHRAYAAITIGGLAIGLAGCLMILNYIRYERSYDSWLPDSDRIYQVQATWHEQGRPPMRSQASPYPVRATLPEGFPQIEALTVLRAGQTVLTRDGQPLFLDAATVDPRFFDIFQLDFVDGSAATALPDTNSVVLTKSEAIREFGTDQVAGRTITIGAGPGKRDYRVSGVIADLPDNSILRLSVLFRNDPAAFDGAPPGLTSWGSMNQQHYVRLREGADAAAINAALPAWEKRVIPPQTIGGRQSSQADILDLKLVPITDVHLGDAQEDALAPGGDPRTLATFAVVALMMLGMAVMNFVNLSTARATQRAREIALRKVLGATRRQLIAQIIGESLVMAGLALLVALALVEVATPWIAGWIGANLRVTYLGPGGMLAPAIGLFVATGLIGGLYPALTLSRFQPATVLRANKSSAETPGSGRLRAGLVLCQFAIAIGLIASTWVIHAQTRYIQTSDPGYRRDGLVELDSAWRMASLESEFGPARRAMLAIPGVTSVARTNLGLAATNQALHPVRTPGAPDVTAIGYYAVDPAFFETMGIDLLAGRGFNEIIAKDRVPVASDEESEDALAGRLMARGLNIVVNRAGAAQLGFASAEQAVGETVRLGVIGLDLVPATIVGVVEDTRIRTARDPIEPIVYAYDTDRTDQVIVRYADAMPDDVMDGLGKVWRRFEPEIPFQGRFAEAIVAETTSSERARGALFAVFAGLAVVIACLGLYSLASFATERRTKEIGIRKVLGAKVRDIVRLLAWQFCKPVVLANLIAWPAAWWAMRDWLNGFDARIPLGPSPFALAGLLALGIAIATVAGHALRVARTNPIHALRYE